jgi:hypothetical protein
MSSTLLLAIVAIVLFGHGIGHAMGIIPALGILDLSGSEQSLLRNWSSDSWVLTDLLGDTVARVVCIGLYLAALVGFIGATLALLGWGVPREWWRPLALVSAGISLVALVLFWNALILLFPHKIGALAVNGVTLVGLLVLDWPSEAILGLS